MEKDILLNKNLTEEEITKMQLELLELGYGAKNSPEDIRDFKVASIAKVTAEVKRDIPTRFRVSGSMTTLNQGSVGSCVAHALATALGYGEIRAGLEIANEYSRGFIYANRLLTDYQGSGMIPREAISQLLKCGDVLYKDFTYNEEYPGIKEKLEKNKDKLLKKAADYKILKYCRCYSDEDIKIALMDQACVVISIPVYDNFGKKTVKPKAGSKSKGNHMMCVIGWDEDGWIIQNSWGILWGDGGKLHLAYDYPINETWAIQVSEEVPKPKRRLICGRW